MLTTQDLVKGIDITGLDSVGGSQLNQLVDVARLAEDKGMVIETQDSAADTPIVPNPDGDYDGILPVWWKRYIWRRLSFNTETGAVLTYIWDEAQEGEEELLFWKLIDADGRAALILAGSAVTAAAAAQNTADTAQANAANAQSSADAAQGDVNTLNATVTAMAESIEELDNTFETLWGPGDLKTTCRATVYSTVANQGWLECDGSLVDRVEFADLFNAIGTIWGAGDGSTTFKIPDFRGRALIGAGTGAGLTARSLGQQTIGAETHTLTGAQSGIAEHNHGLTPSGIRWSATNGFIDNAGEGAGLTGAVPVTVDDVPDTDALSPHNNMQPSAVVRILIKT